MNILSFSLMPKSTVTTKYKGMASLHISKSTISPFPSSQHNFPGNSRKYFLRLRTHGKTFSVCLPRQKLRVWCSVKENDSHTNGEEPPESLFMKELKRRGMTPTSSLEETNSGSYGLGDEMNLGEEDRGFSKRNAVSTNQKEIDQHLPNQRQQSMALNSEGLEGLIPRAKLLLTIGGTFFLGFWPLILGTLAFFCGLYFYFGPAFFHDATSTVSPPPYVDPYALLEDERISSQIGPTLK
ncbi:hypothetical protein K2173_009169 [Erythroxylum novogranatense]|uniref:Tubulin alpha-6 chain n=1 Tax=Erythroxylum novogranatense TaxID=1862640 RepID=A0AAV8TER0_9ROSI|nr:hypothetical protein K2173_009169 [Erythroxylum novogranatense]